MSRNVLSRALKGKDDVLSVPWGALAQRLTVEPGRFVLGLAAPGVGKSMFALNWALKLGQPCLYVSTDTDLRTQAERAAAWMRRARDVNGKPDEYYLDQLDAPIRWADDVPGVLELAELVEAETEFLGQPPVLTIVDVVDDVVGEESYEAYKQTFKALRRIARKYKTTVFGLHHIARGEQASGEKPVSLHAGTYTGEQIAEIVLGMWRPSVQERDQWGYEVGEPHRNRFCVSVLKNRVGETTPLITLDARFAESEIC